MEKKKRTEIKTAVRWAGHLLMLLSVVFIAYKLWGYRNEITISVDSDLIALLIVCVLIYAFQVIFP